MNSSVTATHTTAAQFNATLCNVLRTIAQRTQSKQSKEDLQTAVNYVELANTMMPEEPRRHFREHMLDKDLVRAVRDKNIEQILSLAKTILAESACNATTTEEAQNKDEVLSAIANISVSEGERVMPWNLLAELYVQGCGLDVSTSIPPRVYNFNAKYAEFIQNMAVAFPSSEIDAVADFERLCMWDPQRVYDAFKEAAEPYFVSIQNPTKAAEIYESPDKLFSKLPILNRLPLAEYWDVQITNNPDNSKFLSEMFMQLLVTMAGLPSGLFSADLISSIKDMVTEEVEKREDLVESVNDQGEPDMSKVMDVAMNVFTKIQGDGGIEALLGGGGEGQLDLDEDFLKSMSNSIDLPPDVRMMLDAATVGEQPIFDSVGQKKITED